MGQPVALLRRPRRPARGARPRPGGVRRSPRARAARVRRPRPSAASRPCLDRRPPVPVREARRRRVRRRSAALARPRRCSSAPTAWAAVTDILRRAHYIAAFDAEHRKAYAASFVESLVFWSVLLYAGLAPARRRRAPSPLLFFALFTLAMGVEGGFHAFYNIYLSMDGQIHCKSIPWSIVGTLPALAPVVARPLRLAARGSARSCSTSARRLLRARAVAVARVVAARRRPSSTRAATIPVSYRTIQSTLFDMIYFHGLGALVRETLGIHPRLARPARAAALARARCRASRATPARPRNVLFILQESQRADVTCIEHDPDCKLATRFTNPLVPDRHPAPPAPLATPRRPRSPSPTSGPACARPRAATSLHSVPLLWDYAHAAGYDTAYWTSQNLMFGNARLYVQDIPVSHRCVATELDTQADLDTGCRRRAPHRPRDRRVGRAQGALLRRRRTTPTSTSPTCTTRRTRPSSRAEMDKSAEKNEAFKNYYKDVVYLSDLAVARLVEARAREPTAASARSSSTPRITASRSASTGSSATRARSTTRRSTCPAGSTRRRGRSRPRRRRASAPRKDELVWHLDLATTFFDLLGIWDDPAFAPFRARMMGHPLTRRERTLAPVPLTNCTWLWECAFRNWGMMQGPMKLEAREWDNEYHCFNVLEDPDESNNLGEQACWPLPDLARAIYHVMPNVTPPGRPPGRLGEEVAPPGRGARLRPGRVPEAPSKTRAGPGTAGGASGVILPHERAPEPHPLRAPVRPAGGRARSRRGGAPDRRDGAPGPRHRPLRPRDRRARPRRPRRRRPRRRRPGGPAGARRPLRVRGGGLPRQPGRLLRPAQQLPLRRDRPAHRDPDHPRRGADGGLPARRGRGPRRLVPRPLPRPRRPAARHDRRRPLRRPPHLARRAAGALRRARRATRATRRRPCSSRRRRRRSSTRILQNLRGIYEARHDDDRLRDVLERLQVLAPSDAQRARIRGARRGRRRGGPAAAR